MFEAGIVPDNYQVFTNVEDMGDHRNKDTFTCFVLFRYHPPMALTRGLVQNLRPQGGLLYDSIADALLRDCSKLEGYKTGESQNVSVNLQAAQCSSFDPTQ